MRLFHKIIGRLDGIWTKTLLGKHGKKVLIEGKIDGFLKNVYCGDDVHIAEGVCFFCSRAKINIGSHVMISRESLLVTGRHKTDILGKYMTEITNAEKEPDDDKDINIGDDVWIGSFSAFVISVIYFPRISVL